ncbi:hypothetical protein HUW62_31955 [Myxococcus sp. AM011]|uniref:hypothetical protein n=1 Tax=Myxococcus sp. AM011 TaxID=2745200 RepID=UPI001595AFD9|nr:hypothetical protein [Myxococcus sp. AM011]NVJ25847.1 hypothetical protein [Myxococcus sp. AM011]
MTKGKKFKQRVRARMDRNAEAYRTAHRHEDTFGKPPEAPLEDTSGNPPQAPLEGIVIKSPQTPFERNRQMFREKCLPTWKALTESLSGGHDVMSWQTIPEMVSVLTRIGREAPLNHVLHPDGGGLDLSGAVLSHEDGCIELDFEGTAYVVRPKSLRLVMPNQDPRREWAYFVLETGGLAPSGTYPQPPTIPLESVVELSAGRYVRSEAWDEGVYGEDADGNPLRLPSNARQLLRHFGGPFLIVAKASTYNALDRYSGDHSKVSPTAFDNLVQEMVHKLHAHGRYGKPHWTWG